MKTHQITDNIFPVRIIEKSEDVINAEALLKPRELALSTLYGTSTEYNCRLPKGAHLILDFGKEYSGGLRLLVTSTTNPSNHTPLRIRFGESLGEASSEIGEKGQVVAHSPRDIKVELPGLCDNTIGNSGFRYARIDNISDTYDFYFRAIVLSFSHIDAPKKGYFHCSDERLNEIYDTAVRTAYLCCQNGYLYDGIKRDRLIWSGDLGIEIRTLLENYGDISNISDSLNFVRDNYPLSEWMNSIPSYSFWYLLNVAAYYRYTGDEAFVKNSLPMIEGIMKKAEGLLSSDGNLDFGNDGMAYFLDWPTKGTKDAKAGTMAFVKLALEETVWLYQKLGWDASLPQRLSSAIQETPMTQEALKGLLAMQSLAFGDDDSERLILNGGENMSTFMAYYVFKALAKKGHHKEAIDLLKDYYGSMLDVGATTFFEDFQMEWKKDAPITSMPEGNKRYLHADNGRFCYVGYRMSLCHGWAAGAAPFLLEDIAGLEQIDEKTVRFAPHFGDLKEVEASLMTKYGEVRVEEKEGKVTLSAPKGITILKD